MQDRGRLQSHPWAAPKVKGASPQLPEDPLVTTDPPAGQNLRDTIPELRLIGQAQRTFILADGPDGLYVLDQHATHERIIFDRVFRQRTEPARRTRKSSCYPSGPPWTSSSSETLVQHLELIEQQGFSLQRLGDLTWQINAVPLPLTAPHCPGPEHALQRLLDEFAAEQIISSPQQAVAATIACHSATRAGDVLGNDADAGHHRAACQNAGAAPMSPWAAHHRPDLNAPPGAGVPPPLNGDASRC